MVTTVQRWLLIALLFFPLLGYSWGFWAHKRINRIAVFTLPTEMMGFYKSNIEFITEHAVDPDKRRYSDPNEAPRHYIDIDHYGVYPFDSVPRTWKAAVAKYTEDTLQAYGIVPWHVEVMYYRLVNAFKDKNKQRILRLSADIGHYIADAHVPLHTTENYNGQFTNQVGIHGLLESRIPELQGDTYDFFVGKAERVDKPLKFIWTTVLESARLVDTVFTCERKATQLVPVDQKYITEYKGQQPLKVYSPDFAKAYSNLMGNLVERRMRMAISAVGAFWYSAWIEAGKPSLNGLIDNPLTAEQAAEIEKEQQQYNQGKTIGRTEAQ